ncbi:MAG: acetyl-CoA hydrolase, partial [Nocardia sp.]|nr:acetyl-CoA hydrolase [Nocardia sp.]
MSESTVDLAKWLRPGDRIVLGQACGEPTTLLEALIDQGPRIGGLSAFTATSFSGLFAPGISRSFAPKSMGAIGALRSLTRSHELDIVPCHVGRVAAMIETGQLGCDVALVQVSPAGADGRHSLGLISDYVRAAVARARVVIAEVNEQVPYTLGESLAASEIDCAVTISRAPVQVSAAPIGALD